VDRSAIGRPFHDAFRAGLRELGYIEDRTIALEAPPFGLAEAGALLS